MINGYAYLPTRRAVKRLLRQVSTVVGRIGDTCGQETKNIRSCYLKEGQLTPFPLKALASKAPAEQKPQIL